MSDNNAVHVNESAIQRKNLSSGKVNFFISVSEIGNKDTKVPHKPATKIEIMTEIASENVYEIKNGLLVITINNGTQIKKDSAKQNKTNSVSIIVDLYMFKNIPMGCWPRGCP